MFEFDSVDSQAGWSAAASAIGTLVNLVWTFGKIPFAFQIAQEMLHKFLVTAALVYINHDYSENKESHQVDPINQMDDQEFDNPSHNPDLLGQ